MLSDVPTGTTQILVHLVNARGERGRTVVTPTIMLLFDFGRTISMIKAKTPVIATIIVGAMIDQSILGTGKLNMSLAELSHFGDLL